MFILFLFSILIRDINSNDIGCENLYCEEVGDQVCGIRKEGNGYKLRLFRTKCALMTYGCEVGSDLAFGVISMDYCVRAFNLGPINSKLNSCSDINCTSTASKVCAIKNDGEGFRVRIFVNECQLLKFNCEMQVDYTITDFHICGVVEFETTHRSTTEHDVEVVKNESNSDKANDNHDEIANVNKFKHIIVVDSSMIDANHINQTIDDFFSATHVFDLPVREMNRDMSEDTRRRLVKTWGPVKVFMPWVIIPKNVSDDFDHRPTLASCFHKCPRKCPDTYAPVCGLPGTVAREPVLMFQNHCYMDVAQCKMFWEQKSATSISSAYIESSFLFCLGDQMNGVFRFLPLIRTLQRMGRLRSKANFHYKVKNMKFFNEYLQRQPKLMG